MRSELRALWLVGCITAHVARSALPMSPMTFIWHKSHGLRCWRELREIYREHGLELPGTQSDA
jgi:hypothetical protein